ncbi:MAG: hypothetical protein Q7T10_18645 [Rhodoferax sp.]|uniref:hypothetical protein n=1 Tax=Rhodoferax sp. TaxID=50421 RepID=UPI00271FFE67|nr:hypothetical protein [Rhodoferax sp.]MDO8450815.1 hypothetical protein [Rhodoferax sp.]
MKIRSISLAAALVCVASSSFALTPAQIDAATVQLWINGATAPTASVYGGIRKMCVDADSNGSPDDLHVYLEKTVTTAADAAPGKSAAGKFAAYACTMGPAAGGDLDGKKTVVYHTFDVGSFEAYTPHLFLAGEANPSVSGSVKRLKNIAATTGNTCALTAFATQDPTYLACGSLSVTVAPNASVNAVPTLPVGGVSDTEYTLNQLNLGVIANLADIGSEVSTNVAQGFGLAVSYPLYVAMQQSQGLIVGAACAATGSGAAITAVNTTPACQPNVSRQKYTSLVGGNAGDKDAGLLASTLAGSALQVERRVGTSGTQSSSNAFFLNAPCATGLAAGALTPDGTNVVGSTAYPKVTIRSNNGSGDVKTNITAASNANAYAIGVLSLENAPAGTEKFAFTKLNGVSPTADAKQRQTAIDGDYEFWYELVAFTAATAPAEGAGLMTGLATVLSDPSVTDLRGLFATPLSGFDNATFPNQVSKGYKGGNACAVSIQ